MRVMTTILVSLISDQTIPNILAIEHFKPDELLFVTTEEMERKNKVPAIMSTLDRLGLRYADRSSKVIVQEDSILDCHRKMDSWIQEREDAEFIINLTCGTKIMSIAAYEFFKDYSSKMIYIPVPKNGFIVPFPKKSPGKPIELDLRVNVIQYLTAYGLNVVNEAKLRSYHEEAVRRRELSEWIMNNYDNIKNLLIWLSGNLRLHRDDKEYNFTGSFSGANGEENNFLGKLGFIYNGSTVSRKLTRSEIRYLTGGWLEEFCFNKVLGFQHLGIDDAVIGLSLMNPQGRDNEFDVMFTKENALYFIECKSLDQYEDKDTNVLYKIGALQKEFGLRVKSFLVTTSPYILKNGKLKQSVSARAEQFNTVVVPPSDVHRLEDILRRELKIFQDTLDKVNKYHEKTLRGLSEG